MAPSPLSLHFPDCVRKQAIGNGGYPILQIQSLPMDRGLHQVKKRITAPFSKCRSILLFRTIGPVNQTPGNNQMSAPFSAKASIALAKAVQKFFAITHCTKVSKVHLLRSGGFRCFHPWHIKKAGYDILLWVSHGTMSYITSIYSVLHQCGATVFCRKIGCVDTYFTGQCGDYFFTPVSI